MNCQYYNAVTSHSLMFIAGTRKFSKNVLFLIADTYFTPMLYIFISLKILEVKDYHTGS